MRTVFRLRALFGSWHASSFAMAAGLVAFACGPEEADAVDVAALAVGAEKDADAASPVPTGDGARLRVVAANLTSGNQQSYDPGDGARILTALRPDVALLQEFKFGSSSPEDLRGFVTSTFGADFSYARQGTGIIPNGVVSRYPIVDSGDWEDPQTATRAFAWARIDVPGDKDLWAVSVHLLTSSSGARQAEAAALVARIRGVVPARDFVVLGGDFNTGSRTEQCVRTFSELFRTAGPFPADGSGNGNTSAARSKPLDWLLADDDLDALKVPVVIAGLTFENGLVFDSRRFRPLDAVVPVRATDSGATNMQHMAVVRDFALASP